MSLKDDYRAALLNGLKVIGRQDEIAMFWGAQPFEAYTVEGWGEQCPVCDGRGKDDGGPGPWTCGTCGGEGRLLRGKSYELKKYLPYDHKHPNSGTKWEKTGFKP